MRCLGIDHGARRIGLAYGDDIGVATPLPAIVSPDPAKRWAGIEAVIRRRKITDVVLGHPLNMDGSSGPKAQEVEGFARRVQDAFGLPVHLVDERLTSYEAESTIAPSRRRAVRRSGLVDSRAATIILQDFLDGRAPSGAEPAPPP
jgi:putative Holliday junction resolvase